MKITTIYVTASSDEAEGNGSHVDNFWNKCSIDGSPWVDIRITVRKWNTEKNGRGEDTLPLLVYIDGEQPLYPTYVYADGERLLAFDPGKLYPYLSKQ